MFNFGQSDYCKIYYMKIMDTIKAFLLLNKSVLLVQL